MGSDQIEEKGYVLLKDFRVELKDSVKESNGAFSLCFWLYLTNSAPPLNRTILHQELPHKNSSLPFLLLNEKKKLVLFPLVFLYEEALMPATSDQCVSVEADFPMRKWVHIRCQVSQKRLLLHVNGKIAGEKSLTSSVQIDLNSDVAKTVLPLIIGDSDGCQYFIYGAEVLPPVFGLKKHYVKDPPLQLSIDSSRTSDIEEESDGVWSIVGGKASYRRNFSLDVILLDAFGQPVNSELEVVASLLYADSYTPVEKSEDGEAPLLVSCDGVEYASSDRSVKLVSGRASFKLKISQLSSKCDNKLFYIKFEFPDMGRYPFLEVFSPPIHCISRSRNPRTYSVTCKQSPSGVDLPNMSLFSGLNHKTPEFLHNVVYEAKQSPSSKRVKLGQEKHFSMFSDYCLSKQDDEDCRHTAEANDVIERNTVGRLKNHEPSDNNLSGSENEVKDSVSNTIPRSGLQVTDAVVFKYCLGNLHERSFLLKELVASVTEEELATFADQVTTFSGCSHQRLPIMISKRLLEEGAKLWNSYSLHNRDVLWEILVHGIKEHFMMLVPCRTRSLTNQDLQLLRRISGSQGLVSQENFEQMWCWLYPVAVTLSQEWMIGTWASTAPKWIEGFITKEEAESSLRGPGFSQEPGTFLLRFPTTRSWPHPDAGNLVVTYIGKDYAIHHKLLSLDFIYSSSLRGVKSIQEMLLEEPELSRLGSLVRTP